MSKLVNYSTSVVYAIDLFKINTDTFLWDFRLAIKVW